MGTTVVQNPDMPITLPDHDDGTIGHGGGKVIARLWNLALMADIVPCAAENSLDLQVENFRVCVDLAVYTSWMNQASYAVVVKVRH